MPDSAITSRPGLRCYRVDIVRTREEDDANDVVTGIFLLHSEPVYALIDPRSSHSYINTKLVESGSLKSKASRVSIVVSNALDNLC